MAKKSFTQKNFLAILAFGVIILSMFVVATSINNPPQTVAQANGTR